MNVLESGISADIEKKVIVLSRSSLGAGAYSDSQSNDETERVSNTSHEGS
jgi:hypothetical protein